LSDQFDLVGWYSIKQRNCYFQVHRKLLLHPTFCSWVFWWLKQSYR